MSSYGIASPGQGRHYPKDRFTGEKVFRLNVVCALSLETSTEKFGLGDEDFHAWVHYWAFQVGECCTIYGRELMELVALITMMNQYLEKAGAQILVYVPDMSKDFPFLAGVFDFGPDDVFATSRYMPLVCKAGRVEFRCASRLANYKLDEWGKVLKADHAQLLQDRKDFFVPRYPWTSLPADVERAYAAVSIVIVECVERMMIDYGDTVYNIPYTATGYIRRRVKYAMSKWSPDGIGSIQNELYVYDRLQQAFRGGDIYAAMRYRGVILGDVVSYDRSSSYPDVIVHQRFPMSRFKDIRPSRDNRLYWEDVAGEIQRGRAVLLRVGFHNIRLKKVIDDPYISVTKCRYSDFTKPIGAKTLDEDRLLKADYIECAITDIDLEIIDDQYEWDDYIIYWAMSSRYGFLPQPLVDVVINLYKKKTMLRDVPGHEIEYIHAKQELNSVYGMMAQRVVMQPVVYDKGSREKGGWVVKKWDDLATEADENPRLTEYSKAIGKAFLNYAWGVWVTAWARLRLHEGISLSVDADKLGFVYADTDSVKCRTKPDFSKFNAQRIAAAKRSGAWATDSKGTAHYMGAYEQEKTFPLFKALGRKTYAVQDGDKITVTVSGVPKERGSEEVARVCHGIENFDFGYVFTDSGKQGSLYNDKMDKTIEREGHVLHITPNVARINITHCVSLSPGYKNWYESIQSILDEIENPDYNDN